MALRRVSAVVGFLVLVPMAITVGVLTGPADAAVPSVEGKLLALDPDPQPQYFQFEWVSGDYFTFNPGPNADYRGRWQVRSTVDGSVASETLTTPSNWRSPEIAGRSMVTRTSTADGVQITFTGLGGAPTACAITVPAGDDILDVHEHGALVGHPQGPADRLLQVRTTGGAVRTVTGFSYLQSDAKVIDSDGDTLLLQNYQQLFTIDLADATATLIAETPQPLGWASLTPTRVMWSQVVSSRQVEWKHRDGSPGGTVTVPFSEDFTTLGDDLVVLRIPAGGDYRRRELVPVNIADGQAGAPVLDDVAAARALDDGRLLVARSDAVSSLAPDLTRTTLAAIPPTSRLQTEVVISNGQVLAAFEDGSVRQTTLTAGSWTPRTDLPVVNGGNGLQFGGDTLLRQAEMVVRWPDGGQRQLNTNGAAELGRGGALLSYMSFSDQSVFSIQNPRTGAVLATRPTTRPIAMDGNWVWQSPDPATGVLSGADVVTGQTRNVPSSVRCAVGRLSVAGRWALIYCNAHEQYAVDLLDMVADYRLPDNIPTENLPPAVGDGFVVRLRYRQNAQGLDVPELLVTDLNSPTHPERIVGPLRGTAWPPGTTFGLDDRAPRIVYPDPLSRIRVATVDWLAAPPPTQLDTTAPKFVSATAGARVSPANPVRFSYRFTDNVAAASYDVVYRSAGAGKLLGKWTYPSTWQAIKSAAVSVSPAAGTDACFMVRARDARGNLSAWSPMTCALTPHDDRAFSASGSFARLTYSTAYRGTLTQLRKSGAVLYKDGETGNRVAITVLTAPRQGVVDVTFAGRKIGRISLAATTVSRKTFYLPAGAMRTGRLTVTSVSTLPASIDAVGLLRA
jgi:hypothetical protein